MITMPCEVCYAYGRHGIDAGQASPSEPRCWSTKPWSRTQPLTSQLAALDEWTDESHVALADLSYEGENSRLVNALHAATRALAERGDAQLETTFKALRRTCAGPACAPGVSALSPLLRWFCLTRTQPNNMISALP